MGTPTTHLCSRMAESTGTTIAVRVNIPDLRTQKSVALNLRDTVFAALQLIMKGISLVGNDRLCSN